MTSKIYYKKHRKRLLEEAKRYRVLNRLKIRSKLLVKCLCGRNKYKTSSKCFKCSGFKRNGHYRIKPTKYKKIRTNGYIFIYKPHHKKANSFGYVAEHIYLIEKMLRRPLNSDEVVHHINKKRDDNLISNLKVMSRSEHSKLHNAERFNPLKFKSHYKNYCKCNNLKDIRAASCRNCWNEMKRRKKGKLGELIEKTYVVGGK